MILSMIGYKSIERVFLDLLSKLKNCFLNRELKTVNSGMTKIKN